MRHFVEPTARNLLRKPLVMGVPFLGLVLLAFVVLVLFLLVGSSGLGNALTGALAVVGYLTLRVTSRFAKSGWEEQLILPVEKLLQRKGSIGKLESSVSSIEIVSPDTLDEDALIACKEGLAEQIAALRPGERLTWVCDVTDQGASLHELKASGRFDLRTKNNLDALSGGWLRAEVHLYSLHQLPVATDPLWLFSHLAKLKAPYRVFVGLRGVDQLESKRRIEIARKSSAGDGSRMSNIDSDITRYDVNGNQLSQVSYAYDSNNPNPARQDDLLSQTDTATGITTSQTYDDYGNVLTRTGGRGLTVSSTFDPITGLLLAQTDPMGHVVGQTYNAFGLVATKTDALGLTTSYSYDANGNLTQITSPTGAIASRTLDAFGNAIATTDANGKVTHSTYDAFNRLTSVTTPNGKTTTYVYNAAGKLASVTDPLGKVTTYAYDALGNLVQKVDPTGGVLTRTYDASGNVVGEIDPNGNQKTYVYDAANRLTQKTLPDNVVTLAYDARGNVMRAQDNLTAVNMQYDVAGRLITSRVVGTGVLSDLPAVVLNYGYDADGNRISTAWAGGALDYAYDDAGRLSSVTNQTGQTFGFVFDAGSRLTGISRPGSTSVISWDNSNFLTGISHESGAGVLASFGYQTDLVGNRTAITTARGTASASYDANYQLTALTNPEVSSSYAAESFGYDSNSNRTTDQNGGYAYDSVYQRLVEDYANFYFYDANGNLISKQGKGLNGHVTAYRYSSENQMLGFVEYAPTGLNPAVYAAVPSNPVKEVRYFYDATGRRVRKEVNDLLAPSDVTKTFARQYVYDGQEILNEYDGSGTLLAQYTHSGLRTDDMLAVRVTPAGASAHLASSAGQYQYLKDAQGTVTDIADSAGNKLQHYIYSAFGILLGIQDANAADISGNPVLNTSYGYTGREKDSESGLMYYRARYYDPNVGRFLQRDPDPGQMDYVGSVINAYTYVLNNPMTWSDPDGKLVWFLAIPLIAIAIGAVSGGIWAALQGEDIFYGILMGALGGLVSGVGTVLGIAAAGLLTGAGAAAVIGNAAGVIGGALGGGIASAILGYAQGGWVGALVGFTFGAAGGAISGGGALPFFAEITQGMAVSAPPVTIPTPGPPRPPRRPSRPPLPLS